MDREYITGTVIAVYTGKGYGFIKPDNGGEDLFFHETAMINKTLKDIRVGDTARFFSLPGRGHETQAAHVEISE